MEQIVSLIKTGNPKDSGFLHLLSDHILQLLCSNQDKLFQLLYSLDIDENKAKSAFKLKEDFLIAKELAHLIIERELIKIKIREIYKGENQ